MTRVPYALETDARPVIGLVVLQADETIEDEFRHLLDPSEIRLHITRIPSGTELTPDTIAAMETALPAATGLFPETLAFDAVGYACTSGTSLIGADRIAALVRMGCTTRAVTDPLTATFTALHARKAARVGIVSPYTDEIAQKLRSDFEDAGLAVPVWVSFGEDTEANVARITTRSIIDAARSLTHGTALDAVFLSCTNLRTLKAIDQLQQDMDIPVLSSNLSLARHLVDLVKRPRALRGG